MKKVLSDAAAVGQGFARALNWRPFEIHPAWAFYDGSMWMNMLREGGAFFETPPPAFEDGVFKPYPPTGARTLDSRTAFYYAYTLDLPGMIMRIPGVGSQYFIGFLDSERNPYDEAKTYAKTYKVTLPKDIPAQAFWSFTLYSNQTRSMLQTPQKYPRAGSQSYPSAGGGGGQGRLNDGLVLAPAAKGRGARQLDPDVAGQGLVHDSSTARSSRSSRRLGVRARSNWCAEGLNIGRVRPEAGLDPRSIPGPSGCGLTAERVARLADPRVVG